MSINTVKSKCRTCLSEISPYYRELDDVEENCKIIDMLDLLVPQINIKTSMQFSTLMCQMCLKKLQNGYKFQQLCIETNNRINNLLSISLFETRHNILDPLATQIKTEEEEYSILVFEPSSEESHEELRSDDDWFPNYSILPQDLNHKDTANLRNQRSFQCRYCNKSFEKQNSLSAHCRVHKKKESVENNTNTQEISDNKSFISRGEVEMTENDDIIDKIPKRKNKINSDYKCEVCGKVFDRPSMLDRHGAVHSLDRPYECEICKYRFVDARQCRTHFLRHKTKGIKKRHSQSTSKIIKCDLCQLSFMSMNQHAKHVKNQHPEVEKNKCNYCSKVFILHSSLLEHINKVHKAHRKVKCSICKKFFKTKNMLHKPFLCSHCDKTFCGKNYLPPLHIERHNEIQKHKFLDNPQSFNTKSHTIKSEPDQVFEHQFREDTFESEIAFEEMNADNGTFLDVCGQSTISSDDPDHALLTKSDAKISKSVENIDFETNRIEKQRNGKNNFDYNCEVCGKVFDRSNALQRHNLVHSLDRPYECEICKYRFADAQHFRAHFFQHKNEAATESSICPSKPEDLKCEVCLMTSFTTMSQLAKHVKYQHPEVENHKCSSCSQTFILQASLLKHIHNRHKRSKKRECAVCKKVCESRYRLKKHMRIHDPYVCPHCGKTVCGKNNLRAHIENHISVQKDEHPHFSQSLNREKNVKNDASAHLNATAYGLKKNKKNIQRSINSSKKTYYPCEICGKEFSRPSMVLRHGAVHSLTRPHECGICKYRFTDKKTLKSHLLRHEKKAAEKYYS